MGWLFMSLAGMGRFTTPKAYLDNQLSYPPNPEKGQDQGLNLLKSVWSGSAYYAAVEPYDDRGKGSVFAIICLVRWAPKARNGENFGFKDMSENMGPCERRCPASVLDLLGPTDNAYALEWRQACRTRLALLARRKPMPGDTIVLPKPVSFSDGYEAASFGIGLWRKTIVLKGANGGYYRLPRLMEQPWTLIPAASSSTKTGVGEGHS